MASPTLPSRAASPDQLELPLNLSASPGFKVQRIEQHIVLTPVPLKLWGSTAEAAAMIRRSERWVRILCESGMIKARRLPGAKRWDVDLVSLQEWAESGNRG